MHVNRSVWHLDGRLRIELTELFVQGLPVNGVDVKGGLEGPKRVGKA